MVDRKLRDLLADAIHDLIIGQITNDRFELHICENGMRPLEDPDHWQDAAISPLLERSWCLYGDEQSFYMTGANILTRECRAEVLRWILFLRSNTEYRWPSRRFINPALVSTSSCLLSILSLGLWPRGERRQSDIDWSNAGEISAWPFLTSSEYKHVSALFCPLRRILELPSDESRP